MIFRFENHTSHALIYNRLKLALVGIFLICGSIMQAHELIGVSTRYNDNLTDWIIYATTEENDGYLQAMPMGNRRLDDWRWEVYNQYGNIERSFTPARMEWRLTGSGETITIRPVFPNDLSQWTVTDNEKTLRLQYKREKSGNRIYWESSGRHTASFKMYTVYGRDIRDWEIIDELPADISIQMKVAAVFIILKQHIR